MLARVAQPMAAGITTADPEKMSMTALMPQFVRMEREHGSVIRALADKRERDTAEAAASGPRYGLFLSLAGGMQTLTDALAAAPAGGITQSGTGVSRLRLSAQRWGIDIANGGEFSADAVCMALPSFVAAELLADAVAPSGRRLAAIENAPCASVNVAVRRLQITHPLNGMGFVVPAAEGRFLSAVRSRASSSRGAARGDGAAGGFVAAAEPANVGVADDEMLRRVLADLRDLVGLTGEPQTTAIGRWPRSMPQYHVGHLDPSGGSGCSPHVCRRSALAGNAYRGVGIPDSIASATSAAKVPLPIPARMKLSGCACGSNSRS